MSAVASPTAEVLLASEVTKTFRRGSETVHALRGVDLMVPAGSVVGIAGPSGSGKTTLLAVICGWERPDSGAVRCCGSPDPASLPWSALALVPQTLGLLDDLPARENVVLPARLASRQAEVAPYVDELMQRLGVAHLADRFSDQMSLGEQQRVAVARALSLEPDLLLVDEPTAHQDAGFAAIVLDLFRERADAGGACVIVSHHQQALDTADVVRRMTDGQLA